MAALFGKAECISSLVAAGAMGNIRCENRTVLEAALSSTGAQKIQYVLFFNIGIIEVLACLDLQPFILK